LSKTKKGFGRTFSSASENSADDPIASKNAQKNVLVRLLFPEFFDMMPIGS